MSIKVDFSDMFATRRDHAKVSRPGWFPKDPSWVTGDGRIIPLGEITDRHLINIFKYLDKRLQGEAPNQRVHVHWLTWIRVARWELRSRGLEVPPRTGIVVAR